MPAWLPIPFLVVCLMFLLRAETAQPRDVRSVRLWKPASTCMAIAVALLALPRATSIVHVGLIVVGLALCLVGDVYLIDGDRPESFVRGLFAFLIAHLLFIAAFTASQQMNGMAPMLEREGVTAAILAVLVGLLYIYMREGMGEMRGPVLLYMAVIALMVHRAVGGIDVDRPALGPALAAGGAMLFLISDAILALNRFVFPADPAEPSADKRDRIWVLCTYYAAITLIALSCAV
jgi:uncharacterized membrane protein YhhN